MNMTKKILHVILAWALFLNLTPIAFSDSGTTRSTFSRNHQLASEEQVVPSSATDVATTDTWIFQITITNVTASAATITMTDKATVPLDFLKTVSIAANTTYVIVFPEGKKFKNGLTWVSGTASALNASLVGWYK